MPIYQILRLLMCAALVLLTGCSLFDPMIVKFPCDDAECDTAVIDSGDADTDTDTDTDTDSDTDTDTDTDSDTDTDTSVGPVDADGDGYDDTVDCDDADADVHPGAVEACNGYDDNCDGAVDEAGATGESSWYADTDGDGYGDASSAMTACDAPAGYVADQTDCDDTSGDIHPYAVESCTDSVDMNCDGSAGDADADGDLVRACEDCDDTDATAFPGGVEVCDEVDNDCDGSVDNDASDAVTWYADTDGDGYGDASSAMTACDAPTGYVADQTDCDDAEATAFPGASEVCDSSDVDENCDGVAEAYDSMGATIWHEDADGDGFGIAEVTVVQCDAPSGYVTTASGDEDCNDANAAVNVDATEACNGYDDNCDGAVDEAGATGEGTWYADADTDGYGDASSVMIACDAPDGYVADNTDCDDTSADSNPAATEQCDGLDNDCDGVVDDGVVYPTWYADGDGDGYGDASVSTSSSCSMPSGYVVNATDCDDVHAEVNPGAAESVYTVWDDDCNGVTYTGQTLATGVVATSESFIDEADATFEYGISAGWDVISDYLSLTIGDAVVSAGTWVNTLVGSYEGLEFFGTGGGTTQDAECRVFIGGLETADGDVILAGDDVAVVFDLDSDSASRHGIGVYVGDAADSTTWSALTVASPINPSTDLFEVATGTVGTDDPDVIICAGGVVYDGDVRFTHVALVLYTP